MEWLLAGTLGFWIAVIVLLLGMVVLVAYERPGWTTVTLLATLAFLQFEAHLDLLGLVKMHPWYGLLVLAGYFAAGTGWCIGKWKFYVDGERRQYDEARRIFAESHGLQEDQPFTPEIKKMWTDRCRNSYSDNKVGRIPNPSAPIEKFHIMIWLSFWPLSMIETVIRDPVKRAFQAIYRYIRTFLKRMAENAFKGVENDFLKPGEDQDPPKSRPTAKDDDRSRNKPVF